MEAGAHFQQAGHAAAQFDPAFGRLGDAAQDFEQRGFARAVAANDAHDLALFDFKGNIFERPKFLVGRLAIVRAGFEERLEFIGQHVAQGHVAMARRPHLVPEHVFFAEFFDANNGIHG